MDSPLDDVVICRACCSECNVYKSLYKNGIIMGQVFTLGKLMTYCTNMDILPEESMLPGNICADCIKRLSLAYAFKKMVLETDETLRQQFNKLEEANESEILAHDFSDEEPDEERDDEPEEEPGEEPDEEPNEDGAEELHELAAAAELKQSVDDLQYFAVFEEAEINLGNKRKPRECDSTLVECKEEVSSSSDEQEETINDSDLESYDLAIHELHELHSSAIVSEAGEPDVKAKDPAAKSIEPGSNYAKLLRMSTRTRTRTHSKSTKPKVANPELQCQTCGKQLSNRNSFNYHQQLHSDATPYLCSLCGEGFKTRNAYEGHIVIHDPNNPNTCKLCSKSYRQSSSLRTHMLTHTGEKPFRCKICGKGMTQKSGYKKHLLIHTGEKPHRCETCGRDFRYSSNLIAHKRSHTGEKPYECSFCQKRFPTSEQMKRHKLIHSAEKTFRCNVCDKKFKRHTSMKTHLETHQRLSQLSEERVSKSSIVVLF